MFGLGVVAHVDRFGIADALKDNIDADFMSVDTGHLGPGVNHRIVWSVIADLDTEWSVVLEDDAVPVADFRTQLASALRACPAPIASFYLGRQRPPQHQSFIANAIAEAEATGAHWITSTHLLHAVAVAVRTDLVPDMLANLSDLPIDEAIGAWARSRRHQIAYSTPSLVDHADLPTLVSHPDRQPRTPGRVAWNVGSRTAWCSSLVTL